MVTGGIAEELHLGELDAETVKAALLTQLGKGTIAGFLLSRKSADHKADQLLRYLDRRKLRSPNGEARVLARRFDLTLKAAKWPRQGGNRNADGLVGSHQLYLSAPVLDDELEDGGPMSSPEPIYIKTDKLSKVFDAIPAGLSAGAGGALLGTIGGPIGTVVGGVSGAAVGVISIIWGRDLKRRTEEETEPNI